MMKKKYLAIILSFSMAFSVVSPVMASSDDLQVVDENSDIESAYDDESEAVLAETEDDGWTTLTKESNISYKYDEDNKTLYFKSSGTAALPDNKTAGFASEWGQALGSKTTQVEAVVIGDGITGIGTYNFSNKLDDYPNLKTVSLSSTVTSIGEGAFQKDSSLKEINLNQVESVGSQAFTESGLNQAIFEKEQVQIGENAFNNCTALNKVEIKGIAGWDSASFANCSSLESFQCEKSIEEIPMQTFMNCSALSTCSIIGVKDFGISAFRNCASLQTFDFSEVETLEASAFRDSGLTSISFPNKNITLEFKSLSCEDLVSICYPGTAEEWKTISEEAAVADTVTVHCKADVVEAKAATCTEDGWTEVGVCNVCGEHYSYPTDENKIKATGHSWSNWKTSSEATVFSPEVQTRECSNCQETETQIVGKKLTAKAKLNASTVTLKVKQSTSGLKVTGLAKGDSVKSWKSSNTKIFTVSGKTNGKCKITAKKSGTAKLQITLASGLKKTVKVKVQKTAVKTSKITVDKTVTVKKGKKVALNPVVTPFTSKQKVTYTSSDKKIATVSSKGNVTGKKKGTVKITIKSGSKSVKVTVKVK